MMATTAEQNFAHWLIHLRKDRGHTQTSLAKAVGLDPTALTKIEKGTRSIRLNEAAALALELGSDIDFMLGPPDLKAQIVQLKAELDSIEHAAAHRRMRRSQLMEQIAELEAAAT